MSLIMNETIRRDLLKAHREEAESAGDLGSLFSNLVIASIENIADGVPLDGVEVPEEIGSHLELAALSDAQVVVMTIDFHYGNFTPEAWASGS